MPVAHRLSVVLAAAAATLGFLPARELEPRTPARLTAFYALIGPDSSAASAARTEIEKQWDNSYAILLVELAPFAPDRGTLDRLIGLLERGTGQRFGREMDRWYQWIWQTQPDMHPEYAEFKAALYEAIDPRFREYFGGSPPTSIRLDEIRWGGVVRDGIPPLDHPKMISAGSADYLQDDNVVFAIELAGDARAYPKRILAWHEMVRDRIGGRELAGVYCTLCGSMIFYDPVIRGRHHVLGTSGFLYRSNKLMYDAATKSLWSTLGGEPVVGALVGQGLKLEPLFVVTTTWGEWRKLHPATQVLSLDTGHRRDYGEGVAYHDYFATDELMFGVPRLDRRLPNKAEVLALRFGAAGEAPLVIAADFLRQHPTYQGRFGGTGFVVLTDRSGANRVYQAGDRSFPAWDGGPTVRSADGARWTVSEGGLRGADGALLRRLPAHRAFWFGWSSAFPDTRLVQ
ncbi:MAG: DUF3179 domain-containing protein [Gemmatimonadales bacterium]